MIHSIPKLPNKKEQGNKLGQVKKYRKNYGNTLFWWSLMNILSTISNFAPTHEKICRRSDLLTLYCDGVATDILLTISNFANTCQLFPTLTLPIY